MHESHRHAIVHLVRARENAGKVSSPFLYGSAFESDVSRIASTTVSQNGQDILGLGLQA